MIEQLVNAHKGVTNALKEEINALKADKRGLINELAQSKQKFEEFKAQS
jgi:hypothetical protein